MSAPTTPTERLADRVAQMATMARLIGERGRADVLNEVLTDITQLVRREAAERLPPEIIDGGNTAELQELEDMRTLLLAEGQDGSADGLRTLIRYARMAQGEWDKVETERDKETIACRRAEIERDELRAELRAYHDLLDGEGRAQSPDGLRRLIEINRSEGEEYIGAVKELQALRAEIAAVCVQRNEARAKIGELCREIDDQCTEIDALTGRLATADSLIGILRAEVEALTPGPWVPVTDEPLPVGMMLQIMPKAPDDQPHTAWYDQPCGAAGWATHYRIMPAALLTPPEKP